MEEENIPKTIVQSGQTGTFNLEMQVGGSLELLLIVLEILLR